MQDESAPEWARARGGRGREIREQLDAFRISIQHYPPLTLNHPPSPVHVDDEIDAALLFGDGVDRIVEVHLQSAAGRMIMQAPT